jgi:hypothetical protein
MKIKNWKLKIPAHMQAGQVMMLTVIAIGGTLLGATTVAGLLVIYQLRQSSDAANSAKAIFAADAGIEWGLYRFFKPELAGGSVPEFSNGASVTLTCFPGGDCGDTTTLSMKAVGSSARAARALELSL